MAIDFPDAPSNGDTHTVGDKTWTYDGTTWTLVTGATADHGNLGGLGDDDHTQYLLADGTRTATELTVSGDLTVDTSTLHVDSTNNRVGIGTATPGYPLDVVGDVNVSQSITSEGLTVQGSATVASDLTVDTDTLHVDSTNNRVGIGTTSPNSSLSVTGVNSETRPLLDLQASLAPGESGAYQRGIRLLNSGMTAGQELMMAVGRSDNTRNQGQMYFQYSGDGSTSNRLSFGLYAVDDVLNITGSGNVGIGYTTPSYKLDVNGDINTTGSLRIGGTPVGEWVSFTPSWYFDGNAITATGFNYGYYLIVGDLKIVRMGFRYSSSSGGGALRVILPSAAGFSLSGVHTYTRDGYAHRYDASLNDNYLATPFYWNSGTIIGFYHEGGAANVTDQVPVSWGGNDEFYCTLIGRAP